MGDIHDTAADWFAVKISKGETPRRLLGGPYDGLEYFPVSMDGREYWLLSNGLVDPPAGYSGERTRSSEDS